VRKTSDVYGVPARCVRIDQGARWHDGVMATIQVRYFAAAADAAGLQSETMTVPDAATVAEVREAMIAEHPALAGVVQLCSFLVDGQAAELTDPIGATVDVLPPFAGG